MGTEKSPTRRIVDDFEDRIDTALARWPGPDPRFDGAEGRVSGIMARIDAEKGSGSIDRRVLNTPFWTDALPFVRRPRARGTWLFAGGASTVVLAAAAAVVVITGAHPAPTSLPGAPMAPVRVALAADPAIAASSAEDAVDLTSLPRTPLGEVGAGSSLSPARRPRAALPPPGAAKVAAVASTPVVPSEPESEPTVPVGAYRTGGSSAEAESVPLRPASGAVASAMARVLPAARACLEPGREAVRAAVTFGSNGRVKDVAVSSTELGEPAASCLRTALEDARVGAFATPTFVWTATVRAR